MKRKKKPCPLCESGDNMRLYTIKTKTPEEEGKYSVYVAGGVIRQADVFGNAKGVICCPVCGRKGYKYGTNNNDPAMLADSVGRSKYVQGKRHEYVQRAESDRRV